jgi:hypothetical protein
VLLEYRAYRVRLDQEGFKDFRVLRGRRALQEKLVLLVRLDLKVPLDLKVNLDLKGRQVPQGR